MPATVSYNVEGMGCNFHFKPFGRIAYHNSPFKNLDVYIWRATDEFGFSMYLKDAPVADADTQKAIKLMKGAYDLIRDLNAFDISGFSMEDGKYSYGFMITSDEMDKYDELYKGISRKIIMVDEDLDIVQFYDYLQAACDSIGDDEDVVEEDEDENDDEDDEEEDEDEDI